MTVRSKRFVSRAALQSVGFISVYTVPAGRTAIVHEFGALNNAGEPLEVGLGAALSGQTAAQGFLFDYSASLPTATVMGRGLRHIVLGPGDQLVAFCRKTGSTATFSVNVWAYGSELAGVAP